MKANPVSKKPRILVIDDDTLIRSAIQSTFSRKGYTVAGAKSIEEAFELVNPNGKSTLPVCPYDLILLDIQIGETSGIDLLREMRQKLKLQVPVLMVSGLADNHHVLDAAKLGIRGFVVKPFDSATLEDKILSCLED